MPDNAAYSEKETGWKETKIWIQELVVCLCEKTGDLAIRPSLQQCSCIIAIEHKAAQEWQEYCRHICAQASQEHICAQAFSRTRYIQAISVKVHKTSLCSAAIPMAMCGISRRYLCTRDIMMWYNIQNVKKMYNNLSISAVVLYNLMKYQHAREMYKLWEK